MSYAKLIGASWSVLHQFTEVSDAKFTSKSSNSTQDLCDTGCVRYDARVSTSKLKADRNNLSLSMQSVVPGPIGTLRVIINLWKNWSIDAIFKPIKLYTVVSIRR